LEYLLKIHEHGRQLSAKGIQAQPCRTPQPVRPCSMKLKGRLAGLHSVSINISYRITLEFLIEGATIIPITVDAHEEVY
jgi:hypothetical protein